MQKILRDLPLYLIAVLFVLNIFIYYAIFSIENRDTLTVAFLDVGQGDAIFIEAPNGNQMLIDAGAGTSILSELSKVMEPYDRSIDVVLATHPDTDHIGGMPDVFERYRVDYFLEPGVANDTGAYDSLVAAVEEEKAARVLARRGTYIYLDQNVFVRILFPDRDVGEATPNNASVITQLVYGDTEFLLTGDAPQSVEQYLVSLDTDILESDVLKIGHHGSRTSTDQKFLLAASPVIAVISAGEDNRYGHPHQEVVDRIQAFGSTIISTAESGTIIFESNGIEVTPGIEYTY